MTQLVCVVALVFAIAAPVAAAQDHIPRDAPFFWTPQSVVDRMLELAEVRADDYVMDLGSGDGRIVITAAKKYGVRGMGIEIDPQLVAMSNSSANRAGVGERVKFVRQDLFETDLRPATVLTLYLFRELNIKLRPRILAQLRPGARVVTHDWDMGDWPPDFTTTMAAPDKPVGIQRESKIFLWYVPARLEGAWRLTAPGASESAALSFTQRYQQFDGSLQHANAQFPVLDGRARGTAVAFRIADGPLAGEYAGTAAENDMAGQVSRNGASVGMWKAVR
jgi:SAM-dependent methyltransferase